MKLSKLLFFPASFVFLLFPIVSFAQVASLSLGSGTAPAGGSVSLNLTLSGGAQPAGLQWTFSYSTADFTSMNIAVGASASAASRSLSCFGTNGSYKCLLTGISPSTIANGVVATATLTLSANSTASRPVQVAGTMAVGLSSGLIASTGAGGVVSLPGPVPDTQAPTTPGSLSATGASGTLINLLWGASTDNVGVTGYRIERCQGTGCSTFTQIGTATGTAYADNGLIAGTNYRYRVRAVDAAGNLSGYSAIASATTTSVVVISSLSCAPKSLSAPGAVNCTVTLNGAASGSISVALASSSTKVSVPGSVTIAASATTGSFAATVTAITALESVTITATLNGVSQTDSISLVPSGTMSIFPSNAVPSVISAADSAAVELGMKFSSTVAGSVVGVRFYKSTANIGTHTGSLWTKAGTLLAQVQFSNETGSGWQQANFSNPIAISANTMYVISYRAPAGRYSANNGFFSQNGTDNGPLHALKDGEDGGNGVYRYGSNAFPTLSWQSTNYWVDVVFSPQGVTTPLPVLSNLVCTPSSLSSGASSTCSVTLDKPALTGGAIVVISDNNANLTIPASITIPAGATTASFTATAGTIASDQTAVVTASYGGASRTSSVSLTSAMTQISALTCTPISLGSGQATTCSVTLTKGAPTGGAVVTVTDNNANLTVPPSITIVASATTGIFMATAGTIATNQTATVTASLNGSLKSVAVNLTAAGVVSSIWSTATLPAVTATADTASVELGLKFRSSVAGYVSGLRFYKGTQNTGTHVGSLWSNSGSRLARVTFSNESASGWQQALFSTPVPINANTTYVVSYLAPRGRYAINTNYFAASSVTNGTLTALKNGTDGGNGVYRYGNGEFPNATWQSSNYWVDVVFTTQQPTFLSAEPSESSPTQDILSTESETASRTAANPQSSASALSCLPRIVRAGDSFDCTLRFDEQYSADKGAIAVTVNGTDVRLPVHIAARTGQRSITFHGSVDKAASQSLVLIATGEGEAYAEDQIAVLPAGVPVINVPDVMYIKPGDPIAFTVTARDGNDLPVTIAPSGLPPDATFEAATGHFAWIPSANRGGEYTVTFTATNTAGASSKEKTRIVVAPGTPRVTGPIGLACTAGSIATLQGEWLSLADEPFSDQGGASLELGGTTVRVNGSLVPVLSVSSTRVDFLCPNNDGGHEGNVVLETAMGVSTPMPVAMVEAKPVLLSVEGSESSEGLIKVVGTDRLTVVRDVRGVGEPAQAEDLVEIRATGLGIMGAEITSMTVKIKNIDARVESVLADPTAVGVFQIFVRVPTSAGGGDAIPVQLILRSPTGQLLPSNPVTMAIE